MVILAKVKRLLTKIIQEYMRLESQLKLIKMIPHLTFIIPK